MADEEIQTNFEGTVALAVDSSMHSQRAVEYYCDFIHKPEEILILIHTLEPLYLESVAASGYASQGSGLSAMPQSHWRRMEEEQKQRIRQLKKQYHDILKVKSIDYQWKIIETTASAGETIIRTAEETDVTLIIVGSRGLGALRRTILGSVSDYVLHHAKVPVLICH